MSLLYVATELKCPIQDRTDSAVEMSLCTVSSGVGQLGSVTLADVISFGCLSACIYICVCVCVCVCGCALFNQEDV